MVLIGYLVREADRLGSRVMEFLSRGVESFATGTAYQESESVLHGFDDISPGIHDRLVSDLRRVSRELDREGSSMEDAISIIPGNTNERDRVERWLHDLSTDVPVTGKELRELLVMWERQLALRKREIRTAIPRWDHDDPEAYEHIRQSILSRWSGGKAWDWDVRVIAETHCRARETDVKLVSEDRRQIGKKRDDLVSMTAIIAIIGLDGEPLEG